MGEGKKRVLRKSALVFDDPLEAYEHARRVSSMNYRNIHIIKLNYQIIQNELSNIHI